jgi:curved DNA-binding protein
MEFKDYYKIMGVDPTASQDEIKRSYRKLARKYHPDVSKEKDAEARFKEVGEAYEVLKDAEKRAAYDKLRQGGWRQGERFNVPPDWQFNEGGGGFQGAYADVGGENFSDFFEMLFGQRRAQGGHHQRGGFHRGGFKQRGQDIHYKLPITLEEAYKGRQQTLDLRVPEVSPQGQVVEKIKKLNVKIPPGVTEGQKIRLSGQGQAGVGGGPNGDLYLEIAFVPHPFYTVQGKDVTVTLPVTPWEAALGGKVRVPTLGGAIEMTIPAKSQTGNKLRIKGRGLPGSTAGDQYVILKIMIPEPKNEASKTLYEEMAKQMPFNPREALGV